MKHLSYILAVSVVLAAAAPALANNEHEFASVGLFLVDEGNRRCRLDAPSCNDPLTVTGELFLPYYAYVCVFNGNRDHGISGVAFSIDYDPAPGSGVDVFEWISCSDLEFAGAGFPAPGAGNIVTWDSNTNCQDDEPSPGEGITTILGYFYITAYSNDVLEMIPRSSEPGVVITKCEAPAETILDADHLGWLGFSDDGSETGDLPCVEVVIENDTWGNIKRHLGANGDR